MLQLVVNLRKTHLWSWTGSTGSRKEIGEAKLAMHNAGFQPEKTVTHVGVTLHDKLNSLTTNDAYMRHDPCELSIAYGNLYGALNTRRYTLVQGFCFLWLFLMEGKVLKCSKANQSKSR